MHFFEFNTIFRMCSKLRVLTHHVLVILARIYEYDFPEFPEDECNNNNNYSRRKKPFNTRRG